jgi:hypothetical protein
MTGRPIADQLQRLCCELHIAGNGKHDVVLVLGKEAFDALLVEHDTPPDTVLEELVVYPGYDPGFYVKVRRA